MSARAPHDFGFPYVPYPIQKDFMEALYSALSNGQIGIFESPTGTGKSLSLICGSLRWLQDQDSFEHMNRNETDIPNDSAGDEPDWVRAFQGNKQEQRKKQLWKEKRQQLENRIQRARRLQDAKSAYQLQSNKPAKRLKKTVHDGNKPKAENDDEFLVDDYHSDDDDARPKTTQGSNISKEVQELLAKFESGSKELGGDEEEAEEEDDFEQLKIYYASRTHSQLSQFVHEVNKTTFADGTWTISLGSRKNLCIHEKVQKLGSTHRINEACLELQNKKTEKERCPHLPGWKDKLKWDQFQDHALARVRDIEDLCNTGEELHTCPYYGSRRSVMAAQLVVLPYQHLLHASTRESLGISLKNNVVIIDEAHNLMETITAIHTVSISQTQLSTALSQMALYLDKYKARMLGKNVVYIKQLVVIVKALIRLLGADSKVDRVMNVNEFVHTIGIDHFNMFKLEKYLKESRLARKLNGFIDKAREKQEEEIQKQRATRPDAPIALPKIPANSASSVPMLTQIETFLMALTNPDKDGRVVISFGETGAHVKYMLLNPAEAFRPIVDEARSIILAGGTMEPISDFLYHLFPDIPSTRISRFSCGHIIPPTNLLTMTLEEGPTGKPMQFNFESRQDVKLIDEVGQALTNLCNVIPDGVVCFFSSFSYLETVYRRWSTSESGNILERIAKKKKIFREPRETNMVDSTLRDYSMHIDASAPGTPNCGALLLCVVNGKMSEGINFSDRLGRGVVMVGLPFANRTSVELEEKIKYAKDHVRGKGPTAVDAGQEYYENLCMRGVNQSIGRAIRHKNDYAVIILLDKRYSTSRIRNKLPGWIGDHVECNDKFGKVIGSVGRFFREKRNTT